MADIRSSTADGGLAGRFAGGAFGNADFSSQDQTPAVCLGNPCGLACTGTGIALRMCFIKAIFITFL